MDTNLKINKGLVIFKSSLHGNEVYSLFEDFNQDIYDNNLKKVDYNIWKTFKKFSQSKSSIYVEVKFDTLWDREFVTTLYDDKDSFTVIEGDNSLGDFITAWVAVPIVRKYCRDYNLPFENSNGVLLSDEELVNEIKDYIENIISPKQSEYYYRDDDSSLTYKIATPEIDYGSYNIAVPNFNQAFYCTSSTAETTAGISLSEAVSNCIKEIDNIKLDLACKEDKKITTNNTKEKNNMNSMFNFDFGPVNSNNVRMSMYGLAVKNKDGKYVSYNVSTDEIMDVDILNFDGNKFLYKMPVAVKDISVGDIVVHQHLPMFVVNVNKDGKSLKVVDPINGEKKEIMLAKSPFGFNFATKIVNFIANAFNTAEVSADNPFGNMWMLAMMSNNSDVRDLVPLMLMNQLNGLGTSTSAIPLMMMALMNQSDKMNDIMPLMMMNMMNQGVFAPPSTQN